MHGSSRENPCAELSFIWSGVTGLLTASSMLMSQQYILNKVSLNKHIYYKVIYWASEQNVTRGSWKPNLYFL